MSGDGQPNPLSCQAAKDCYHCPCAWFLDKARHLMSDGRNGRKRFHGLARARASLGGLGYSGFPSSRRKLSAKDFWMMC